MMKIIIVVLVAMLSLAVTPAIAQSIIITDPEETNRVLENAEVTFTVCDFNSTAEFTDLKYYNDVECEHNILFLKGQCEESNNTAYNWCYDADMERYLNNKGIKDAPRPPDTWCNMNIDGCIAKWEAMKDSVIESSEVFGTSESEATTNLLNSVDDTIQELEDKKDAAQGDNDNDDDE
ncbi:MAG: hypothetical protein ACRD47_04575 [Nitrososphaeraceae archaeon]